MPILSSATRRRHTTNIALVMGLIMVSGVLYGASRKLLVQEIVDEYTDLVLHVNIDRNAPQLTVQDDSRYGRIIQTSGGSVAMREDREAAMVFDGEDDGLTVVSDPMLAPLDAMTVMAWVYPERVTSPMPIFAQVESLNTTVDAYRLEVRSTDAPEYAFTMFDPRGSPHAVHAVRGGVPKAKQWSHVAVTFSRGALQLYQDGQWLYDALVRTDVSDMGVVTGDIRIGISTDQTTVPFRGMMHDIRLYRRVLSDQEIECASLRKVWVDGACEDVGKNNRTPTAFDVRGPSVVEADTPVSWNMTTFDPDRDAMTVIVDWGDGTTSTSALPSGVTRRVHTFTHQFSKTGMFAPKFTTTDASGGQVVHSAEPVTVSAAAAPSPPDT